MPVRRKEEERLKQLSQLTVQEYQIYADDLSASIDLLKQLDDLCDDNIFDHLCNSSDTEECHCVVGNMS